jgi:hypothetical protein
VVSAARKSFLSAVVDNLVAHFRVLGSAGLSLQKSLAANYERQEAGQLERAEAIDAHLAAGYALLSAPKPLVLSKIHVEESLATVYWIEAG